MLALTARQQQILDFIREFIDSEGYPPTRAEIAKALGFRSANAAEDHLKALAKNRRSSCSGGIARHQIAGRGGWFGDPGGRAGSGGQPDTGGATH